MKRALMLTRLIGLGACGQKGPLYFAPEEAAEKPAAAEPSTETPEQNDQKEQ